MIEHRTVSQIHAERASTLIAELGVVIETVPMIQRQRDLLVAVSVELYRLQELERRFSGLCPASTLIPRRPRRLTFRRACHRAGGEHHAGAGDRGLGVDTSALWTLSYDGHAGRY